MTDACKVGIAGVLLQENCEDHLRPCAYWARKLKDVETRYSAYDREPMVLVEDVFRVLRLYLLGYKCILAVTYHAILVHLLKHVSDKLRERQSHRVNKLTSYTHLTRILFVTRSCNATLGGFSTS